MPYLQCITCPCCQLTSHHPVAAANGYCGRCHWWTSDPMMAPYHFALPCEHRGQDVQLPPLEPWHHFARIIGLSDDRPAPAPFAFTPTVPVEYPGAPWLHTRPGTMLEIGGHIRGRRRPRWSRYLRAARRIIARVFNGTA